MWVVAVGSPSRKYFHYHNPGRTWGVTVLSKDQNRLFDSGKPTVQGCDVVMRSSAIAI